ncbi:MAG TPA: alpha/beta hydrolase [Polyangiaceae bacterium]|nr:alpha/beta hydrolase [Polyangiaceae bacterium]
MTNDDDLVEFEARGCVLPTDTQWSVLSSGGALLAHASWGAGPAVLLLHGGLGNASNWGKQIPFLRAQGFRVIAMDTRGHGRSTRDARPFSYEQLAEDACALLDHLGVERAAFVGWSDGACTSLAAAKLAPERVRGVFFFACNVDEDGTLPFEMTPVIGRCFSRHMKDYQALSATPEAWNGFVEDVGSMQRSQPRYGAEDLASVKVPVLVALGEHDEFIRPEHAEYLAKTIPGASLTRLPGVSHFAPLQRPSSFNDVLLRWLREL